MNSNREISRRPKKGAAFLLLIVMVSLAVLGATQFLVRGELTSRRGESDRLRTRAMVAAIDTMQSVAGDAKATVKLPIDASADEFIEVGVNSDESIITARWFKGRRLIDEMKQSINKKLESSE